MTMAPDSPGAMTAVPTRGDMRPVPDPTVLTTQQLYREIAALRELFTTKFDGYDRAIQILQQTTSRSPTPGEIDLDVRGFKQLVEEKLAGVETKISALQELHTEKFASVAQQFRERDTRSERESRDNKVAVDAAFAAQKEAASEQNKSNTLAIDKSEKATAETLNKQADLFKSTTDALSGRVEDAKEMVSKIDTRVTSIESRGVGAQETTTSRRQDTSLIAYLAFGILGLAVGVTGIVLAIAR